MQLRAELISWARFYSLCRRLVARIDASGFRPEVIVAIARGGYMPARVLADFFGVMDLATFRIEHYRRTQKRPETRVIDPLTVDVTRRRVLLVDDVSDSGDTFEAAIRHINERGTPAELRTAAIHHKIVSRYTPDFFAARVKTWHWLIYPWALLEDLTGFVEAMKPRPEDAPALVDRLQREHGIRVSEAVIRDVLATLGRTATRPPEP
ncbi:MAG: phosphoribosyltransferase [Gammaproteobacteria bacterium]|nr:phosphoribosyltransferase [Gammaproteobacteria bacterium]